MSGNKFELINTLSESRMFRNKQSLIRFDAEMTKNTFFLYMLSVYILSQEGTTAEWAERYASRTHAFGNFDHFRTSATDFYMLAYMLVGKDHEFGKVDVELIYRKSNVNVVYFKQFLKNIATSVDIDSQVGAYFMRMERELGIRDGRYRSVRRQAANWNSLSESSKKQTASNLYKYIRSIDIKAEVLPELKRLKGGVSADDLTVGQKALIGTGIAAAGFAIGYNAARKK